MTLLLSLCCYVLHYNETIKTAGVTDNDTICIYGGKSPSRYKNCFSLPFSFAALSMLRSSEDKAPAPQNKFMGDIEELAASYERKLIEVGAVSLFFIV